jgi:hypothetical protein
VTNRRAITPTLGSEVSSFREEGTMWMTMIAVVVGVMALAGCTSSMSGDKMTGDKMMMKDDGMKKSDGMEKK